jgi:diguanylate cyclase (GGDEF)-like protein/PAS domain S-box-containing protein
VIDRAGVITYVNKAWIDFAMANGMPTHWQFVGTNYLAVCSGLATRSVEECLADGDADATRVYAGIQSVLNGEAQEFAYDYPCHSPVQQRWFIMRIAKVPGNDAQYLISHHETTGSKRQIIEAKAALQKTTEYTQTILDHMADGVLTLDAQGMIESFNHAACNIFGYTSDEVVGRSVVVLVNEAHRGPLLEHLHATCTSGRAMANLETTGLRQTQETFPLSLSMSNAHRAGEPIVIAVVRDITQQHLDAQEIRRLAFFDALTGLPNRRLLMDRLSRSVVMSGRTGKHCALMFLDLDNFKRLNDTMGHHVGDQLLQQVSQRLQLCVREGDSVARLGGDEFVVLLEELSENTTEAATDAEAVAHKILICLGQPYALRDTLYTCTPSIGIAVYGQTTETVEDLLKKADVAMYQAKAAGRNIARFFDPVMQAEVQARAELEQALRAGLQRQEFVVHYQTQVRTAASGLPETIGAEALVRWQHPELGLLSPAHFIAVAEESGLILPLGQWVMHTACAQLVAWSTNPHTQGWTVSVNVSARQFEQADFVDQVRSALSSTGANPTLLTLELTESLLLDNMNDAIYQMQAIKACGVRLSLDDFGTGYSSLTCLKRRPIDELKIDQSFVNDQLQTIVSLGHSLGMHVIAEGIETPTQLQLLSAMGCDAFQGYHFSRPCAVEKIPF